MLSTLWRQVERLFRRTWAAPAEPEPTQVHSAEGGGPDEAAAFGWNEWRRRRLASLDREREPFDLVGEDW